MNTDDAVPPIPNGPKGRYALIPSMQAFPTPEEARPGKRLTIALAVLLGASLEVLKPNLVWGDYEGRRLTERDYILSANFNRPEEARVHYPPGFRTRPYTVASSYATVHEQWIDFASVPGFYVLNLLLPYVPGFTTLRHWSAPADAPPYTAYHLTLSLTRAEGIRDNYDGHGPDPAHALAVAAYVALLKRAESLSLPPFAPFKDATKEG